jgi:hypothetical protein
MISYNPEGSGLHAWPAYVGLIIATRGLIY